ncbi:MAG: hypothetical protein ACRC3Z_11295 [Phocaeicola sp.]
MNRKPTRRGALLSLLLLATLSGCHLIQSKSGEEETPRKVASPDAGKVSTLPTTTWNSSYGGADKAYDTQLLTLREEVAPRFEKLEFKDKTTGLTMAYRLYTPTDYDKSKQYPLVQFIADASTVGKGADAPLMQGYGGIIWATEASQKEHPCFVLVPSFFGPERAVNDQWETSTEVGVSFRLLNEVVAKYNIDRNRIYTTGQSMGGMISFYLNATHPDFFAASIFVGSQWNIDVLQPLTHQTFCYIVSAGDDKASNGMREVRDLLAATGVKHGETEFSARLPQAEQEEKVEALLKEGHKINFISFEKGSVIPEGSTSKAGEHMYSFDYAYQLKSVRDWLFTQKKGV